MIKPLTLSLCSTKSSHSPHAMSTFFSSLSFTIFFPCNFPYFYISVMVFVLNFFLASLPTLHFLGHYLSNFHGSIIIAHIYIHMSTKKGRKVCRFSTLHTRMDLDFLLVSNPNSSNEYINRHT